MVRPCMGCMMYKECFALGGGSCCDLDVVCMACVAWCAFKFQNDSWWCLLTATCFLHALAMQATMEVPTSRNTLYKQFKVHCPMDDQATIPLLYNDWLPTPDTSWVTPAALFWRKVRGAHISYHLPTSPLLSTHSTIPHVQHCNPCVCVCVCRCWGKASLVMHPSSRRWGPWQAGPPLAVS